MTMLLRQAVKDAIEAGQSLREIARESGLQHPPLLRFLRGEQSLRLDKAEMLAEYVGLETTKGRTMKAHKRNTKTFRELTLAEMRASIAAQARHLKSMKKVYQDEKAQRAKKD